MELTFYTRHWCHLCHDFLLALAPLQAEFAFSVRELDVDEHPELEALYGEHIPVLLHDGHELCRHVLDERAVRRYLLNLRD